MVDIHCHILPGVDDGSRSWEMTAEMCRMAADDGITHIVATPHSNDVYAYDRQRYTAMLGPLHDAGGGRLTFSLGCDFHFSPENICSALDNPRCYVLGDTQYLLIEFSDLEIPARAMRDVLAICSRGMVPIITHPERNPPLLKDPDLVLKLVELGCLVQVTANAVTGAWGERSRRMAEWLLSREAVHVIASDAHDPVYRRPIMSEARDVVAGMVGAGIAEALVTLNPEAIVGGKSLPWQPLCR
ncbi:MAG TPA: CpsB/CapC family capsule biosynthesis tyrosine phosphatase [Candidatus Binatia bacterium]|nr:CpsB/CapC family capsule biosynthesis tyrosine phosphatase [Candidatus Binatia bacterium]